MTFAEFLRFRKFRKKNEPSPLSVQDLQCHSNFVPKNRGFPEICCFWGTFALPTFWFWVRVGASRRGPTSEGRSINSHSPAKSNFLASEPPGVVKRHPGGVQEIMFISAFYSGRLLERFWGGETEPCTITPKF